ncbi:TetR/AcrR family transcriptional regulator [Nocardia sp. NBC_00508]|uniref:TetR/AcrR family transcriptional regulator n=1 Tax=Nocardia sp. NBC_00508 TaxID=2975992 RepID=UPI002E800B78|nr:TetR/AcrR family transcriptional regulator [Nocardia sp. NBC_00508]WUD67278.1 TetR/AcrR family transcriptional regulator [Nocardia sp. NBC_00508]
MAIIRARSYHHGDLRAELLQRAEATLRESGVDGLSLRGLARDVGVSHAAPTRHFKDKQALLDAIAVSGFERLAAALARTAATDSFDGHIRALARTYLRFATENPALIALMFARRYSPAAGDAMSQAVDAAFATPISLIAEAQTHGEVIVGDPRRIALSAVATLQGLATFVGSGVIAAEAADELLDETTTHLIEGLRPRR